MRWLLSSVLALGLSMGLVAMMFAPFVVIDPLTGWALASANSALVLFMNKKAQQSRGRAFVVWGAVGNVLRTIAVIVIILLVNLCGKGRFETFIVAFLAAYFVFMVSETIRLHQAAMKGTDTKDHQDVS
jgi:hypothetical protein